MPIADENFAVIFVEEDGKVEGVCVGLP